MCPRAKRSHKGHEIQRVQVLLWTCNISNPHENSIAIRMRALPLESHVSQKNRSIYLLYYNHG